MGDLPEIIEEKLEGFEKKLKSGCGLTEEEMKELHDLFSAVEGVTGYETIVRIANRVKAMVAKTNRFEALMGILTEKEISKLREFVTEVKEFNRDCPAWHKVREIEFEILAVRTGKFGGNISCSPCITAISIPIKDIIEYFRTRITVWCIKCRTRVEISNPKLKIMKNKRPACRGKCPVCGTFLYRVGVTEEMIKNAKRAS